MTSILYKEKKGNVSLVFSRVDIFTFQLSIRYNPKYEAQFSVRINSMKLHICSLYVSLLLSLCIPYGSSHYHSNSSSEGHNSSNCSPEFSLHERLVPSGSSCQDTQEVQVIFSSSIVENEYIIKFNGYYKARARESYIGAALNSADVRNWRIILRDNAASIYPSDFDIVHLKESDKYEGLRAVSNHPLVKTVSPQRLIRRTLKFINATSSDSNVLAYRNPKRRINVSLQIVSKCHLISR